MRNSLIKPIDQEFSEYLRDESRTTGIAESISFPRDHEDVVAIINEMRLKGVPVTVQGARTGVAGGAVPHGGHIINLSKMNRVTGMRIDEEGTFYVTCEAGLVLSQLNKQIEGRKFNTAKWSHASKQAFKAFCAADDRFFSPDPTEASATIGGMAANNASGARSYLYGATRNHVSALRIVLANGQTITIRRGEVFAEGRVLILVTDQGTSLTAKLPTYRMPETKNASGYYIEDNMDAIDLFIGSGGTLGIITEIEVRLLPLPKVIWGVSCCFENENNAVEFVKKVREQLMDIAALEFFDGDALEILRRQKEENPAFAKLRTVEKRISTVIYTEVHCADEEQGIEDLIRIAELMRESGGDDRDSFVARTDADRDSLYFFRHAVPESVNMVIDKRRKDDPVISKLAADMAVPDRYLSQIMEIYRSTLSESGLESAIWGHIGDNHLHVNILPRNAEDYRKGHELYARWAADISRMGGAVSAEHGIGKLKTDQLELMYGHEHIEEMAALKKALDPQGLLCPGNLFSQEISEEAERKTGGDWR